MMNDSEEARTAPARQEQRLSPRVRARPTNHADDRAGAQCSAQPAFAPRTRSRLRIGKDARSGQICIGGECGISVRTLPVVETQLADQRSDGRWRQVRSAHSPNGSAAARCSPSRRRTRQRPFWCARRSRAGRRPGRPAPRGHRVPPPPRSARARPRAAAAAASTAGSIAQVRHPQPPGRIAPG